MSKQKIKYIIAIVLLTGVFSQNVFANSPLSTSVGLTTDVEGVIRNDTLGVDTSVSIQQNTEVNSENATQGNSSNDEKISPISRTGNVLTDSVDTLVLGTIGAGVTADSEDFCKVLDATLMKQSDEARASLAWNSTSYQKNIDLKYQGGNESQASLHESSQNAYKNASAHLKNLKPKSDTTIDAVMLSRYQAIARSALVELTMTLKAKTFDSSRADNIALLLNGSLKCIDAYSSSDESNAENLSSVKTSLGELVASWDVNKNSFGVEGESVEESFYLEVSSKDTLTEEDKVPSSADEVMTKEDLSLYVRSLIQNNSSIKNVAIEDNSVTVKYATRGKLLGFIPVWLSPKTTVDTMGNVKVSYPWYSGISSKKVKLTADVVKKELTVLGLVAEEEPVTPVTEMSMQYRARLVESLDGVIKSGLEVKTDVDIDTEAEIQLETDSTNTIEGEEVIEVLPQA